MRCAAPPVAAASSLDRTPGKPNNNRTPAEREYEVETGKAYRLEIRTTGAKEHALIAPDFFCFVCARKVETGDIEIKANSIYELEFEEEGECEMFFVPIKSGRYEFKVRGLEAKGMVALSSPSSDC